MILDPSSQTNLPYSGKEPVEILRDGVQVDNEDLQSEDLTIEFDFNSIEKSKSDPAKSFEYCALADKKSKEILVEPLVAAYLNLKWQSLKGWWYGYRILFFLAFGVCLTLMISLIVEMNSTPACEYKTSASSKTITIEKCAKNLSTINKIKELVEERSKQGQEQDIKIAYFINFTIREYKFWLLYAFTVFGMILVTIAESSEAFRNGYRYFTSATNWLDIGNLICAGICLICTLTKYKDTALWFGATSVLLSWVINAKAIGDMPIVGNWVYLFGNTVKKVTTFLLVFTPLLFGFGLRFKFMFPTKVDGFVEILYHAIFILVNTVKYSIDDVGETVNDDSGFHKWFVKIGAYGTFVLALVILTISLTNVLIGLAINLANEAFLDAKFQRVRSMAQNLRGIRKFITSCGHKQDSTKGKVFIKPNRKSSKDIGEVLAYWAHIWHDGGHSLFLFWNAIVLGEHLVYECQSDAKEKNQGVVIGTIPDECATDAISMIQTRNAEIEEREREKENLKVQEQRARVLALLEEKEEENQKVQEENQRAKMERERILELLENVMIALQKK